MSSQKFVARLFGVYTKPTSSEDRFISELERRFPGSDWIGPEWPGLPSSPKREETSSRFSFSQGRPRAASTSLADSHHVETGTVPSGGPGALNLPHRKSMLDNYEEIHKYRQKFWAWKRGTRKSRPARPELPGLFIPEETPRA